MKLILSLQQLNLFYSLEHVHQVIPMAGPGHGRTQEQALQQTVPTVVREAVVIVPQVRLILGKPFGIDRGVHHEDHVRQQVLDLIGGPCGWRFVGEIELPYLVCYFGKLRSVQVTEQLGG